MCRDNDYEVVDYVKSTIVLKDFDILHNTSK